MIDNQQLINHLINSGVLHSPALIRAFERCDRALFVPDILRMDAYGDFPLQIGAGQTISQPTTVAIMLELLDPNKGDMVLDIGSGSGWTTALLAHAVGENGYVEGLEIVPSLIEYGRHNLSKLHIQNATISSADPSVLGRPENQYDRILVSASAHEMPKTLFDQLKPNGILVIPVRESIWKITKGIDGRLNGYEYPGFRFVPLITP